MKKSMILIVGLGSLSTNLFGQEGAKPDYYFWKNDQGIQTISNSAPRSEKKVEIIEEGRWDPLSEKLQKNLNLEFALQSEARHWALQKEQWLEKFADPAYFGRIPENRKILLSRALLYQMLAEEQKVKSDVVEKFLFKQVMVKLSVSPERYFEALLWDLLRMEETQLPLEPTTELVGKHLWVSEIKALIENQFPILVLGPSLLEPEGKYWRNLVVFRKKQRVSDDYEFWSAREFLFENLPEGIKIINVTQVKLGELAGVLN